ncbi:hypothetical protein [Tolypothrix sp. VBCCA 56010]
MQKPRKNQASKLMMGLAISFMSAIALTGIANQIVFAQTNKQQMWCSAD